MRRSPRKRYSVRPPSIPDDVVFQIFALLAPATNLESEDDAQDAWAISQVSRQWRAVAMDSPTLWSKITLRKGLPYVEAMLKRTRRTPVRLHADLPLTALPEIHGIIASNAHRIRGLALRYDGDTPLYNGSEEDVKTLLRIAASSPVLESLCLFRVDVSHAWRDNKPEAPLALQHIQILDAVPCLLPLLLAPLLSRATRLTISGPRSQYASNMENLVALLGYMPLLETLVISGIDLEAARFVSDPEPPIAVLPSLALFRADDVRVDHLRYLLQRVALPSTTRFRISTRGCNTLPPSPDIFKDAQHMMLACVSPSVDDRRTVLLSAHLSDAPSHPPDSGILKFSSPHARPESFLSTLGRTLNHCLDLRTVELVDFDLDTLARTTVCNLARDLAKCKTRTVRFTRCSSLFVTAVFEVLDGRRGRRQVLDDLPCPLLDTVEVRGMRYREEDDVLAFVAARSEMVARRTWPDLPVLRVDVTGSQMSDDEHFEDAMFL